MVPPVVFYHDLPLIIRFFEVPVGIFSAAPENTPNAARVQFLTFSIEPRLNRDTITYSQCTLNPQASAADACDTQFPRSGYPIPNLPP
jgi:hypothetical protein